MRLAPRLARSAAGPLLALALLGCATMPSGHHPFSVAAGAGQAAADWSLGGLPRHGRIHLVARTFEETTRNTVANLRFQFGDDVGNFALVALDMRDPGCEGAYSFTMEHRDDSATSATEYFDRKLPWGAQLEIDAEWWPDGRLEIAIAGVGKRALRLPATVDRIQVKALSGGLRASDLDFRNLAAG
jgi:hypothetical protein